MSAELERLRKEAQAVDAEAAAAIAPPAPEAPPAEEPAPAPAMTPEQEARAVLDVLLSLALPFYPALDRVYTEEAKARLAGAAGPVMAKYNFTLDKFLARWMAEINLAFVALPVLMQTAQIVRAARDARKKPDPEKKPEAPPAPAPVGASAPVIAGST